MARLLRDAKLDTRTARLRLTPRGEPYWRTMEEGRAVGYRRLDGGKPGTWTARLGIKTDGKTSYKFHALGNADDFNDADGADGATVLTFGQAQKVARDWFQAVAQAGGRMIKPLTVSDALALYMKDYISRSDRATKTTLSVAATHILSSFGPRSVADLTTAEITDWRNGLVQHPAHRRKTKDGKPSRADNVKAAEILAAKRIPATFAEARRKRQASANRVLTLLKAILNHAFKTGRVESDLGWRRVAPFKNADQPRIRYLTDDESQRLVAACEPDFQALVIAALLTGADYGELRTARVRDLDTVGETLTVSKKRGPHAIRLTIAATSHFATLGEGKGHDDLLMTRKGGEPWEDSHQVRRMAAACEAANIVPRINYHVLRHTFATRALRRGAPMHHVAHQLGHTNTRTTERHYAHVIPSDAGLAIQQSMGDLRFSTHEGATAPSGDRLDQIVSLPVVAVCDDTGKCQNA